MKTKNLAIACALVMTCFAPIGFAQSKELWRIGTFDGSSAEFEFRFRYVATSATTTDAAALSRKGWEEFTPLEENEITSQDKALDLPRPLDGNWSGFIKIDDPDVLLETWKPAEDGNGTILRLLEFAGKNSRNVTIAVPLVSLEHVTQTDAVERNLKTLSLKDSSGFEIEIHRHEIVRFESRGSRRLAGPRNEPN